MLDSISPTTVWLIVGIALALAEMALPGLIIGFFSLGAIITTLTTWAGLTNSFAVQMIVFLATSIVFLTFFHSIWKKRIKPGTKGDTTDFNLQLGKIVPVTEFIDPGEGVGKVRYQGALWNARSETKIAPGESARIKGCDNLTLIVEPVDKGE
ncbi:NfeD family protein [Spirochaeta isovalerica]|uniref:Membrane protein implicated in regulation of membrane protease activity n=1 Tax=Spirochaeta isovalerica TaxID=150 RepID=A0A841RA33_9SPIO|nr:NfeD family protein [Spirochaeta isovalerica]MBB6480107.1 membrane protein implicated in regulation of membrane protease activity [Spirochaeta isovalerica]